MGIKVGKLELPVNMDGDFLEVIEYYNVKSFVSCIFNSFMFCKNLVINSVLDSMVSNRK